METEPQQQASGRKVSPWLLALLAVALVGLLAYQMWPSQLSSAAPPVETSNTTTRAGEKIDPASLRVKLDALKSVRPDQGELERNPFRFKPPPAPPPPPPPKPQPPQPTLPPQPIVPTVPPIPLKFMGTVERGTLKLAALTDCKGFTYSGREGESIDGRYRLVRIGEESVVMEYLNGTGRVTIRKIGDCPKQ
jgi:hypothetical protein